MTDLDAARRLLRDASRIVVFTGAGVSAESGVATFRDAGGVWARFRPEEVATPEAFARDPRFVWEWYGLRREAVARCEPNAAHRAIARLAAARDGVTIVTQNVDGLHQRAATEVGADAGDVIELHGSLVRVRCSGCGQRRDDSGAIDATSHETLPRCDRCDALLRPDVVWFGEMLPAHALETAQRRATEADACLIVGTSAVVYPAASIPLATADAGGALIEVNPEPTPLSPLCAASLRGTAASLVPALLAVD